MTLRLENMCDTHYFAPSQRFYFVAAPDEGLSKAETGSTLAIHINSVQN
jgi:hypothetical protein